MWGGEAQSPQPRAAPQGSTRGLQPHSGTPGEGNEVRGGGGGGGGGGPGVPPPPLSNATAPPTAVSQDREEPRLLPQPRFGGLRPGAGGRGGAAAAAHSLSPPPAPPPSWPPASTAPGAAAGSRDGLRGEGGGGKGRGLGEARAAQSARARALLPAGRCPPTAQAQSVPPRPAPPARVGLKGQRPQNCFFGGGGRGGFLPKRERFLGFVEAAEAVLHPPVCRARGALLE